MKNDTKTVVIYLPIELKKWLDAEVSRQKLFGTTSSMNAYIRQLIVKAKKETEQHATA